MEWGIDVAGLRVREGIWIMERMRGEIIGCEDDGQQRGRHRAESLGLRIEDEVRVRLTDYYYC